MGLSSSHVALCLLEDETALAVGKDYSLRFMSDLKKSSYSSVYYLADFAFKATYYSSVSYF